MREDIKKRIEQVRAGKVPERYLRTRAGIMPDDWLPIRYASEVFSSYTNKKHDGKLTVLSSTQDKGIIPRDELGKDIQFSDDNIYTYKKVDKGDFIISLRSFQGGIECSEYEGLVSPAYTVLKPRLLISHVFYKNYLKTPDMISRLNTTLYGIRDGKQIGFSDFGELILHYPPFLEQQKIAEILNHCDKVIELKKQLIEGEQNRKKWLMEKLLYSSYWEIEKLGKLCNVCGGGTPNTSQISYWRGDIPWISSTDITEGDIYRINPTRFITQEAINSSATQICPKDSLLLVSRVGVGKLAIAPFSLCTSQDFTNLINIKGNTIFMALQLQNILAKMKTKVQGTSIKGITVKEIKSLEVYLPSPEEQNAIAKVISVQDNKINLLEQELAQWQQKKKALMQLLLTGLVRVSV